MARAHRTLGAGASSAVVAFWLLLLLAACGSLPPAGAPRSAAPAAHTSAAPPMAAPPDPSFDWRALVAVPFGSDRQSLQASLHEVLFFRDDSDAGGKADAEDCYTSERAAPRLVGRAADQYFLCFRNDRLRRIEAVVSLSNEAAAELFRRFCDTSVKGAEPMTAEARTCEGGGGGASFRASLEPAAEDAETELSIIVEASAAAD